MISSGSNIVQFQSRALDVISYKVHMVCLDLDEEVLQSPNSPAIWVRSAMALHSSCATFGLDAMHERRTDDIFKFCNEQTAAC